MTSARSLTKDSRLRRAHTTTGKSSVLARRETALSSDTIDRLLAAASEEFGLKGYEGASIEGIARRAGAGKMTIYRHFGDKHALFHALVQRSASQISVVLDFMRDDTREPERVLMEAARRIQEASSMSTNQQLMRMVIAEAQRFPELAQELLSLHEASTQPLKEYFSRLVASGVLARRDPDVLARMFFRMSVEAYRTLLLANYSAGSQRAQSTLLRSSIEIFLHGAMRRARTRTYRSSR